MKDRTRTETSAALGEILSRRGLTQYSLAKNAKVSQPFVNQVANGRRSPSAQWIDLVAEANGLSMEERQTLHRAAAKDHGFKIDLTKG